MTLRRPTRAALLAACAVLAVAGCGGDDEGTAGEAGQGEAAGEPHREGLALELGGLTYNVFLTRQLNLALPEDRAYYHGPPERLGHGYYGVFLQVCNAEDADEAHEAATEFKIVDSQGAEFEPVAHSPENQFAYPLPAENEDVPDVDVPERDVDVGEDGAARRPPPAPAENPLSVEPDSCIPAAGSVAALGPTAGAMLLFEIPFENTENRPLELEIEHEGEKLAFELDF